MGRKCKLTPETQDKLLMFIRDGLNLRDACYGADIGVSSFHRWRNLFPDFDKAVNQATSKQWESSLALAKYGCRKYKRKFYVTNKYPSPPEKPLQEPLRASQSVFPKPNQPAERMMYGLPVGDMYSSKLEVGKKYYDPKMGRVFHRDKNGCLSSARLDVYLKNRHDDTPFVGVIF